MVRTIAIDDEPLALRQLKSYISRTEILDLVGGFRDAISAQKFLKDNSVDLIFCDINMPELNGIDFVRTIQSHEDEAAPMIIFTTAYAEYAIEGFRLDAVDYLLKPFPYSDFARAAQRAHSLFMLRNGHVHDSQSEILLDRTSSDNLDDSISIKADYKVILVKLREIIYMKSEGEYVRVHIAGSRPITTLARLKNMENQLPSEHFVRIHRSYIINIHAVGSYDKNRIDLSNEVTLPIGLNYRETFISTIKKFSK